MDIIPVNGHILIKPLEHKTLLPTDKGTFEEIGIVVELPTAECGGLEKGDRVFFDSWLSAKYPTGENDEYFYLVPFKDIRAVKKHGNEVPE